MPRSLPEIRQKAEADAIRHALRSGGRREAVAVALGISLRTLQYKMRRYGITSVPRETPSDA